MKTSLSIPALLALLPLSAMAQSLQCGEAMINVGTSAAEVSVRCGPPTQIEHQTIYGGAGAAPGPLPGLPPGIVTRSESEIPVEFWTYNFGPNRLMQRIRLENGVVVRIESLDYGF